MTILINIFFVLMFISILVFLERKDIKNIPLELYFIFGAGGYIISTSIIILFETY